MGHPVQAGGDDTWSLRDKGNSCSQTEGTTYANVLGQEGHRHLRKWRLVMKTNHRKPKGGMMWDETGMARSDHTIYGVVSKTNDLSLYIKKKNKSANISSKDMKACAVIWKDHTGINLELGRNCRGTE